MPTSSTDHYKWRTEGEGGALLDVAKISILVTWTWGGGVKCITQLRPNGMLCNRPIG
jgi:hypothetical protein